MNYEELFAELGQREVRYSVVGACGQFAASLIQQTELMSGLHAAVLCDRDLHELELICASLGIGEDRLSRASTTTEVESGIRAGRVVLVDDWNLAAAAPVEVVVESTGLPGLGVDVALRAFDNGSHVIMVNKECDSVAGVTLSQEAASRNLVYTTADGDQPANLIGLVTWARILGLDVVAAGKSSEYDFVYDPGTQEVQYLDQVVEVPGFGEVWDLGQDRGETVQRRSELLASIPQHSASDYCEMGQVANSTGLTVDCAELHYPIARTTELADLFAPRANGGLLSTSGIVEVFNALRQPGEASFAGGVFIVVRVESREVWNVLHAKGHQLSHDGSHATIFLPYHLMGVESPISILSAALHGRPSGARHQQLTTVMAARAERDLDAGTPLPITGAHHSIAGLRPILVPGADAEGIAPFYMLGNRSLTAPVKAGEIVPLASVDVRDQNIRAAWSRALASRAK